MTDTNWSLSNLVVSKMQQITEEIARDVEDAKQLSEVQQTASAAIAAGAAEQVTVVQALVRPETGYRHL